MHDQVREDGMFSIPCNAAPSFEQSSTTKQCVKLRSTNNSEHHINKFDNIDALSSSPSITLSNGSECTNPSNASIQDPIITTTQSIAKHNSEFESFSNVRSDSFTFANHSYGGQSRRGYGGNETNVIAAKEQQRPCDEWQEFLEWKQFKQFKQASMRNRGRNANIVHFGANSSNIYNHHMWNANDAQFGNQFNGQCTSSISTQNGQSERRFDDFGHEFYENKVAASPKVSASMDSYSNTFGSTLFATDCAFHQVPSSVANSKYNECSLSLPSLSSDCNGNITKYEAAAVNVSQLHQSKGRDDDIRCSTDSCLYSNDECNTNNNNKATKEDKDNEEAASDLFGCFVPEWTDLCGPESMLRCNSNESEFGLFSSFQIGSFDQI